MATYTVTVTNWNDPEFWAALAPDGRTNLLDLSALPATFSATFDPAAGRLVLSDGKTTFDVADASAGGYRGFTFSQFDRVWGTQGDDLLTGTAGRDQFSGGEGDNVIRTGDGDDIVTTQSGDDSIATGGGDDVVYAAGGTNSVDLGDGNDVFLSDESEPGIDRVAGGSGQDTMDTGAGDDLLAGGSGGDKLHGGDGADIVAGDAGDLRVVAETDFSDGVPDWITTPEGEPVGTLGKLDDGEVFLGPFEGDGKGSETIRATFDFGKGAATGVVTFDFVRLDSWDDSERWGLDERLVVHVNGEPAFSVSPQWDALPSGSFAGGRWEVWPRTDDTHLGGDGEWTDRIFTVRIVLDDPGTSVSIGFGATTNQDIEDESWGIDNIRAVSLGMEDDRAGDDALMGGDGADLLIGGAGTDQLDGGEGNDSFEGGAGDDRLTTGGGRDTIVVSRGGGTDVVTDFAPWDMGAGATMDRIDISQLRGGSGPGGRVTWRDIKVTQTADSDAVLIFPEGERLVLLGVPPEQFSSPERAQATGIPCFTAGTLIRTPTGEVPVERLRPGDLVLTRDNGPQPVRWVAMRRLGPGELAAHPELRPVRIAPGALGNARPLLVSPQHGMLVGLPGGGEGFARAIQLARMRGGAVRIAAGVRSVTYLHLAFDRHEVVFSNGIPSESFHPGERALAGLTAAARAEFARLFPDLAGYGGPARRYLRRADLPARLAALPIPRL